MLAARSAPRTTRVTEAAYLARCRAARPAELPPPTTNTCWPSRALASAPAAPSNTPTPRHPRPAVDAQPGGLLGQDQVGPEQPGLLERPVGQIAAAHPAGEAEVVADHRAGPGLPARPLPLHH